HAPVMMDDIRVGQVVGIRLSNNMALVTMSIDPKAQVPQDVTARVRETSLLGERIVDLVVAPGLPAGAPLLATGQAIGLTEVRPDLEDLVNAGNAALGPITGSEVATLVDEGAKGFGGNGGEVRTLLDNFQTIVHAYAQRSGQIVSLIDSLNQFNSTLAAHAQAQGQSVVNSARALSVLNQEGARLQAAIHALARLSVGARGILDAHSAQMNRFFAQMRVILGVLRAQQGAIAGILKYAPIHNTNTQLVEYQEFNQILQDFVICGFNDNPNDRARTCQGGR
ncbi:MAG TPA: MlaD family protein, partial [Acidimicrobiales bacterium]|nr:MlaD family protein [Acidimicrobiales bacterium]